MKAVFIFLISFSTILSTTTGRDFDEGLLWKISGNGLENPSYLFGTIHLICLDDFLVFEGVSEKLSISEYLVLELDLTDPALMNELQKGMMMEGGAHLSTLVSKDEYEHARKVFIDSFYIDLDVLGHIQPYFLITLLYPHILGCLPKSYEQFFINHAQANELPVKGLETIEEQLHVFEALSYSEQAKLFIEFLNNLTAKRQEFEKMLESYLSQDLGGLWQLISAAQSENEEFVRRLHHDRNHRWIPRMVYHMEKGSVFFAVGAGHLPGQDGVLQLLYDRGFTVERIQN